MTYPNASANFVYERSKQRSNHKKASLSLYSRAYVIPNKQ